MSQSGKEEDRKETATSASALDAGNTFKLSGELDSLAQLDSLYINFFNEATEWISSNQTKVREGFFAADPEWLKDLLFDPSTDPSAWTMDLRLFFSLLIELADRHARGFLVKTCEAFRFSTAGPYAVFLMRAKSEALTLTHSDVQKASGHWQNYYTKKHSEAILKDEHLFSIVLKTANVVFVDEFEKKSIFNDLKILFLKAFDMFLKFRLYSQNVLVVRMTNGTDTSLTSDVQDFGFGKKQCSFSKIDEYARVLDNKQDAKNLYWSFRPLAIVQWKNSSTQTASSPTLEISKIIQGELRSVKKEKKPLS